jgi:hypothetical protein
MVVSPHTFSTMSKKELITTAEKEYKKIERNVEFNAKNQKKGSKQQKVHWEKSFIQQVKNKKFLVSPISLQEESFTYLTDGSKVRLSDMSMLVSTIGEDTIIFEIVTKLPDKDYLFNEKAYPDFTGHIFVEDLNGNYKEGYQILQNNVVRSLVRSSKSSDTQQRPTTECSIIDWYSCASSDGGVTQTCRYMYSDTYCWGGGGTSNNNGATYGTVGQGESTGGSGGTTTSTPSTNSPGNGYAGLCASTINWTRVGSGLTSNLRELGITAI